MFDSLSVLPTLTKRGLLWLRESQDSVTHIHEQFVPATLMDLLRVTRPLSNIKNLAIVVLAYYLASPDRGLAAMVVPTLALSLVCSAMYTFNSLLDVRLDRRNATKRVYADAVIRVGMDNAFWIACGLAASGLVLGSRVNGRFLASLLGLLVTALLYSTPPFRFKERSVLDVVFGAALTFPLRFVGSWYAFSATVVPPLLPLLGLLLGKSGAYVLYKELDRDDLTAAGIRNTTTMNPKPWNAWIAVTLIALSIAAFLAMVATSDLGLSFLGSIPRRALILLPLSIPPLLFMFLQATKMTAFDNRLLRALGLLYALGATIVAWRLLA